MITGFHRVQTFYLCLAALVISGCTGTVRVDPEHDETPLFRQVDAHVGTHFSADARTAEAADTLARFDIGNTSVGRFEQAFSSMFTETVPIPDWPPWRTANPTGIDGVIELEWVDADIQVGDDAPWVLDRTEEPDIVSVAYRVCLYETDGKEVRCWETSAEKSYQRMPTECVFGLSKCLERQFEAAIRDAVATFMVTVETDPTFLAWVTEKSGTEANE
jgi:hypothetical protein